MGQFIKDQVTLTITDESLRGWTAKEDRLFKQACGINLKQWLTLHEADYDASVAGDYLAAFCWIENRRKWPDLTFEAIEEEMTLEELLTLSTASAAEFMEKEGIDQEGLAGQQEPDAGPLAQNENSF